MIDIGYKNLVGSLDLVDFVNLEELNCRNNHLTILNLSKCSKLKRVSCQNNELASIIISYCPDINHFDVSNNLLTYFDFASLNQESNWININSCFTEELIQTWQNLDFTYHQTQDWINIGLKPTDAEFCAWLRDVTKITPKQVLNESSDAELRELFQEYQKQQQAQIEQPPK